MMIYLVVETFRTECKGFIWHTEYTHTVKSFTNREDACNFIYNNYRKFVRKRMFDPPNFLIVNTAHIPNISLKMKFIKRGIGYFIHFSRLN